MTIILTNMSEYDKDSCNFAENHPDSDILTRLLMSKNFFPQHSWERRLRKHTATFLCHLRSKIPLIFIWSETHTSNGRPVRGFHCSVVKQ